MNNFYPHNSCILAIAPSTRGFGYAVLEARDTLVDWGGRVASGDKNTQSLAKAEALILQFKPRVLVLEDAAIKESRRSLRVRKLIERMVVLARRRKVGVKLLSRKAIARVFFADGCGTKHDIAKVVGERFPDELELRVPPKRRSWESETRRMDFFEAVALGLAYLLREANRVAYPILKHEAGWVRR